MSQPAPLALYQSAVKPDWIDYNGHMNVAYYVLAFDQATDALLDYLGMDAAYRQSHQCSVFTLELHVNYLRELLLGDPLRCTTQLLDHDAKKIHYFHHMYHAEQGYLAATNEILLLHVDLRQRRSAPMPRAVLERLSAVMASHRLLPRPEHVTQGMGIRRP